MKKKKVLKYVGRVFLVIFTTLFILVGMLYLVLYKICNGPSLAARDELGSSLLESGQMKFLARMVLSKEELEEIQNKNGRKDMDTEALNKNLIHIESKQADPGAPTPTPFVKDEVFDENGVRVVKFSGASFLATMMIIKDPSQVCVGTTYPWKEKGQTLDKIVDAAGAIGGINGGLYESSGNKGGHPYGVVVQNGEITYNSPQSHKGLYMIAMNNDNLLIIKDLKGMNAEDVKKYVKEEGIRDCVCFQEESSDKNNHFVPLVINGEGRELNGTGSGANPRTAIGQRADGAILFLVTDGRGSAGHLGATASDLIAIMLEYGAVNAANLDGGSSSSMYYNGKYEMTSTTFYYQNDSWNLPTAYVVKPKTN